MRFMKCDSRMRNDVSQILLELLEGDMLARRTRQTGIVGAKEHHLRISMRSGPSNGGKYIYYKAGFCLCRGGHESGQDLQGFNGIVSTSVTI